MITSCSFLFGDLLTTGILAILSLHSYGSALTYSENTIGKIDLLYRLLHINYLYPLNKKLEKGFEELLQRSFTLRLTNSSMKSTTNLMKLRCDFKDASVEKHGVKLGLMLRFIKVAVSGLQNQTTINEVIDGDDIIYRDYIDISVAVGTPKGLVVPVIRNADKMNCGEMEKEINSLAKKANEAFN